MNLIENLIMQNSHIINSWKIELSQISNLLLSLYQKPKLDAQSIFEIEKQLLLGCLASRRLIELDYVSDKVSTINFKITKYPRESSQEDQPLSNLKIGEEYDMLSGQATDVNIKDICSQVLHAKEIFVFTDGQRAYGFYFSSLRDHRKFIYYAQIVKFFSLFASIIANKPVRHELEITNENNILIKPI